MIRGARVLVATDLTDGSSEAILQAHLLEPMRSNVASMLKETLARHPIQGERIVAEGVQAPKSFGRRCSSAQS